jgi:hypothetical protein
LQNPGGGATLKFSCPILIISVFGVIVRLACSAEKGFSTLPHPATKSTLSSRIEIDKKHLGFSANVCLYKTAPFGTRSSLATQFDSVSQKYNTNTNYFRKLAV